MQVRGCPFFFIPPDYNLGYCFSRLSFRLHQAVSIARYLLLIGVVLGAREGQMVSKAGRKKKFACIKMNACKQETGEERTQTTWWHHFCTVDVTTLLLLYIATFFLKSNSSISYLMLALDLTLGTLQPYPLGFRVSCSKIANVDDAVESYINFHL